LYLGGDSYGLARLAGRPGGARGRDALDLCTGSGVAALHAARFYDRVVGVDINPRAINFARFNALLNGLGNVAFEVGDLYAGLGAFDLITANPPFVPTARPGGLIYRDGGAGGQEILARVVAGLSEHLRPGGACAIVLDLVEHRGRPYDEKLRAWLGRAEGFNCAIMKGPAIGAYDYAIAHHAAERWGGDAEDAELDATLAQYSAEGIESVSPAYICIGRRAESSGETRIETVPISRLLGPDEILPDLLFEIVGRVEALRAIDLETAPLVSTCRVHGVVLASESPFYRRFPVSPEMNAALELLLPLGSAREVVAALRRTSPDFGEADAAELFRTLAWMFVVGLVKRP
jgi:methylase of polypeptide subunit release factors